ncbi:MAG: matrixin family metalloprotease [Myxococcales bacterium]|nr:matrixin family metalloprotease [Myxococcales bacterium]
MTAWRRGVGLWIGCAVPGLAWGFVPSSTSAGAPISWPEREITWYLNEVGSDDLGLADVEASCKASFEPWNQESCSDLRLVYGGLTSRSDVGFRNSGSNINVVTWVEQGWPHADGVIAVTTVTYCTQAGGGCPYNGAILDADVEMNGEEFRFTNRAQDLVLFDVANTLTHEVGHFIGLDHTPVRLATMFASAPPGETRKRDLHEDDVEGLCHLYPVGEESPIWGEKAVDDEGCTATPGAPSSPAGLLVLALGGLGLLGRRRRR